MKKKRIPKTRERLTQGELDLLEMLWREGPVSLSQAHAAFGSPIGYTTVQTRLNRMVDKKVVKKSKSRPALYQAAVSKEEIVESDLGLLLSRVSEGKVVPLVAHLVQDRDLSATEIEAIRELIDNAEAEMEKGKTAKKRSVSSKNKRSRS